MRVGDCIMFGGSRAKVQNDEEDSASTGNSQLSIEERCYNVLDNDKKIDFLKFDHQNLENTIKLADSKVSMTVALQSIFTSVGIGTPIVADVFDHVVKINDNTLKIAFYIVYGVLIIFSLAGFLCITQVYWARSRKDRSRLIYYKYISENGSIENFRRDIETLNAPKIIDELTREIYALSCIVKTKMLFVNISIVCLFFNILSTIVLIGLCARILSISL